MNAVIADHIEPPSRRERFTTAHHAAFQCLAAARGLLTEIAGEMAQTDAVAADKAQALQRATADEEQASMEDASLLAQHRRDAEAVSNAADRRARSVRAKHAEQTKAVDAARAAFGATVDALQVLDGDELAAAVGALISQLHVLADQLRPYVPDELNTPIGTYVEASPAVQQALALVRRITRHDDLNVPVNVLRGDEPVRRDGYAARRQALLAGEIPAGDLTPNSIIN